MMSLSGYQRKKVLVTGAGGFIGSHLVEMLLEEGAQVIALVHYNGAGNIGWISDIPKELRSNLEVVLGDITDSEFIENQTQEVDVIFNLAALIAIPFSYKSPRLYFSTNLTGTMNVLEAARKSKSRVIHISTSEVYGTPSSVPIVESHPIQPQSPYAASKAAADNLCYAYSRSFDLDITIIRPFNTYGPRQSTRAIIPTVLSQVLAGASKVRVGALTPVRDFTYVLDTARAIAGAGLQSDIAGETIQLGTGKTISIEQLLNMAKDIFNSEFEVEVEQSRFRPEKSEVMVLHSDPSKAKISLNWEPSVDFREGLQKTGEWMSSRASYLDTSGSYHV
jgi:NAD dependent epimerase/dehydratase